jgi:hypothetical protein
MTTRDAYAFSDAAAIDRVEAMVGRAYMEFASAGTACSQLPGTSNLPDQRLGDK